MSCPFAKESLDKLKQFVDVCVVNPDVLSLPDLNFFKVFIESFGGKVPPPSKMSTEAPAADKPEEMTPEVESEEESDLELDTEGCVEPDTLNENQKMGDPNKEVSEEDSDRSSEKRMEAMQQFSEGNHEKAIELFTEAIELNPSSALLFAKRGQAYLKQTKPNACIKDCSRALELNPDSAAAYKFRGRAYRLLGEWEKAAKDLRQACNIDFDEQTDEWLKEVTPNAKKIEQHNLKLERKKAEKEEKEKLERARKAREAHTKAGSASQNAEPNATPKSDDFYKLLQDPEIMAAFTDPEVSSAFADISSNPANFYKYKNNPKVMALITKLSGKLAASGIGPGGFPGFPGGFPGFGGMPGGGAAPPTFTPPDDDNLD
ncbi:TPR 11 domain containing protein [Asbolus verrucosus]|uniref:TPR 11 domain containing protein n=1 Tax=Asbolus verrucosus TaxID=1661398 RepID=A0A482VTL3_ASBVE|nr:TPR 11 domain containing protein [Asbolus verrucosus]